MNARTGRGQFPLLEKNCGATAIVPRVEHLPCRWLTCVQCQGVTQKNRIMCNFGSESEWIHRGAAGRTLLAGLRGHNQSCKSGLNPVVQKVVALGQRDSTGIKTLA